MVKCPKRKSDRLTRYGFYAIFAFVTYFTWCDLCFFRELSTEQNLNFKTNRSVTSTNSIKLRMQDHFGQYIDLPFTKWLNSVFRISEIFWVTPNVITAMHFALACICGRLSASPHLSIRRIAVVLYFLRTMLDALDGVVYRAQNKRTSYVSGWGTYGYFIDATADTFGALFILLGTLYRFLKCPPLKKPDALVKLKAKDEEEMNEKLLYDDSSSEENNEYHGLQRHSKTAIYITGFFFAGFIFCRSALWDHFNRVYHDLLAVPRKDILAQSQADVLSYRSTCFSLWLWKINSADAFMNYTLFAIYFGKLWEWARFNVVITIPNLLVVCLFCQLHLNQTRQMLGVSY